MTEDAKLLVDGLGVAAAFITAFINVIALFVRAKVDPAPLKVIKDLADNSTVTSKQQADSIESLRTTLTTEMRTLSRAVNKMSGQFDSLAKK